MKSRSVLVLFLVLALGGCDADGLAGPPDRPAAAGSEINLSRATAYCPPGVVCLDPIDAVACSAPNSVFDAEISQCVCSTGGDYPLCDSNAGGEYDDPYVPPPGDENTYPGGGGGTTSPPPPPPPTNPPECDPTVPGCLLPLRPGDMQILNNVFATFKSTFKDPAVEVACTRMRDAFLAMLEEGKVYRGNYLIDDDPDGQHKAAYYNGKIHIDEGYLDVVIHANSNLERAQNLWVLERIALHEGAHVAYPDAWHPSREFDGNYIDFPFKHSNGGPGAETCQGRQPE